MKPDSSIQTSLFRVICGIYGWRRGKTYLYIGQSRNIFRRLFGYNHATINVVETCKDNDTIDIWYCQPFELDTLESALIKLLKPKYNKRLPKNSRAICKHCKNDYKISPDGAVFCSEACFSAYVENESAKR